MLPFLEKRFRSYGVPINRGRLTALSVCHRRRYWLPVIPILLSCYWALDAQGTKLISSTGLDLPGCPACDMSPNRRLEGRRSVSLRSLLSPDSDNREISHSRLRIGDSELSPHDRGYTVFYASALSGTVIAAGLSNLYYPSQDVCASHTMTRIAIDLGNTALYNLAAEFGLTSTASCLTSSEDSRRGRRAARAAE